MTETTPFEDFTVAETQLWGKNIGQPFSDYPHVFRSVITLLSSEAAQNTPAKWYARWLDKRPTKVEQRNKVTGEYEEEWPQGLLLTLRSKYGTGLVVTNLCDWVDDVLDEYECETAMDLRRKVTDELMKEAQSAGNWDLWLCHLAWVMQRRAAQSKQTAATSWLDFINNTTLEKAKDLGIGAFTAFMTMKNKTGTAADEDADDGDDGESPLDEASSDHQAATAGV